MRIFFHLGALKSIFPKEDINLLSTMTEKDREVELYHLMHIAIGIRIFTKETHQKTYGAFIDMCELLVAFDVKVNY
jgi:hypothetical protein